MKTLIEQEFDKMVSEIKSLEDRIKELNFEGVRVNEELSATVEILKNQIDSVNAK